MKQITEFLSTKVAKPMKHLEFPDKPKYDEVKSFLLDHGFKEYDLRKTRYKEFSQLTERRFGVYEYNFPKMFEISICDKGKETEDNPMFTLYTTEDGSLYFLKKSNGEEFIAKEEIYDGILQFFHTYEEFLDKINDRIDWNNY